MGTALQQRNVALANTLRAAETNGQALAYTTRAIEAARLASEDLASYVWDIAAQRVVRDLTDYVRMIVKNSEPMMGSDPNAPVAAASWKLLRANIGGMYALIWAAEETLGPDARETFVGLAAQIFVDAVKSVPVILKGAIEAAGDVAGAAGAGAGNALAKVLKGTWPVLLVLAVVAGAGIYVAAKVKA